MSKQRQKQLNVAQFKKVLAKAKAKVQNGQTDRAGKAIKTMGITSQREWLRVVDGYIREVKGDPKYTPKQKARALRAIRGIGRHAVVLDKFHYEVAMF